MVVLAETLCIGQANPYPEVVSIPTRTKHLPFHDGSGQCHKPAVRYLADRPSKCCHIEGSVLVLLWADWAPRDGRSQVCLGEWKSIVLSSCVAFIPATVATLFAGSLGGVGLAGAGD